MMLQPNAICASEATSHPAIARTGPSIRVDVSDANAMRPSSVEMKSRPVGRLGENGERARG
jgi:hypothetical protein